MNEFVHDDACRPWVAHQMPSFSSLVLSSQGYGGGGVYVSNGATVTFNDCQITSNTANYVSKQARSGLLAVCFALPTSFYTTLVLLSLCFVGCRGCIDSGHRSSLLLLYFLLRLLLLLLGQIHKVSGWVSECVGEWVGGCVSE